MEQQTRELTSQRISASGLTAPERNVHNVVHHIGAVQAQLFFGAQMAVLNRSTQGTKEITRLLDSGQLVISWLNRGTLHMVTREDFWDFQELTAPSRIKTLTSRFKGFGVDPDHQNRVLEKLAHILSSTPASKEQLVPLMEIDQLSVPSQMKGIVAASFLELASAHGLLVRGPKSGTEPSYVSATQWVGQPTTPSHLDSIALRYSLSHFGSSAEDFAAWLGIGIRDAKRVWPVETNTPEPAMWTGLLGPFDPLLHGWKDRSWLLGDYVSNVISTNGVFRPSIIVENTCVGVWKYVAGKIKLDFFTEVSPEQSQLIHDKATVVTQSLSSTDLS